MMMRQAELHDSVAKRQGNICQIVGMKQGKTVYSDCWNGYRPDDALHVMSVTKSVVSLLVGIAIERGLIADIRQPVLDFFPEYTVKRGEKTLCQITLEHLLTMTAPYKYRSEPWSKVCSSDDWTVAALDLLGGRAGLTGAFKYSTLGIHVLTGVIAKTSGLSTVDFANRYLFEPLDIAPYRNYLALTAEEHKAFILSKEPRERVWFCDPQGVGAAGYGLCLSAQDMAKLGQLCLDGGLYNGKQVVPSKWIAESTRPRIQCDESFANMRYGYLWWTPDADRRAYAALGNSGNVIYVNPEQGTVIAISGTFKPTVLDRVQFIRQSVEPLVLGC